jgi:pseudaminic acid synthase
MEIMKNSIFIIAELSANHNNDLELALQTIESIAKTGADAVKVQTYKPSSLTLNTDKGFFQKKTTGLWKGYTPWKLYEEASLPYEWHEIIKTKVESLGMVFFSSPFDIEGVDFLEKLGVQMYKIASLEINNYPLIRYVASKGKPIILSTGVVSKEELKEVLNIIRDEGNNHITLLKCTADYPAKIQDANLKTLLDLKDLGVEVGLSDHTNSNLLPIMSVALGAKVIEKHFILDRDLGGPDSQFSLNPIEFKSMVEQVRNAESALGKIYYNSKSEDLLRRKSIFVSSDIKKGEIFTKDNIRIVRPGNGLSPSYWNIVVGNKANKNLSFGTPLKEEDFE